MLKKFLTPKIIECDTFRYASALTDVHILLATSVQTKTQDEFLLRYVYYDSLARTLKSLGFDPNTAIHFDTLIKGPFLLYLLTHHGFHDKRLTQFKRRAGCCNVRK